MACYLNSALGGLVEYMGETAIAFGCLTNGILHGVAMASLSQKSYETCTTISHKTKACDPHNMQLQLKAFNCRKAMILMTTRPRLRQEKAVMILIQKSTFETISERKQPNWMSSGKYVCSVNAGRRSYYMKPNTHTEAIQSSLTRAMAKRDAQKIYVAKRKSKSSSTDHLNIKLIHSRGLWA
jgi:hypothetical protein